MIERDTAILKPAPQPYHSSLGPWQELMRPGDIPGRPAAIIGSVTGAFIRLGLIFLLAASVVALIWVLFDDPTPEPYAGVSRRLDRYGPGRPVLLECQAGLSAAVPAGRGQAARIKGCG